ncbi:MAG: phytanoyl-CoA dioxygenase family protein [SAR86 cluster bacterium]|jgi:ectoine hydroxylase-related dioxygenase (phytanoyl-CoA dioxygenase family)|nr:phytanoyl-CoA dioxygenase family protein [SAR86 cluster bacterium]
MDNNSLLDTSPKPTRDLELAKKDLDKFGFCFIPNVLIEKDLEQAKKRLVDQAEAEEEQGVSFRDGGVNQNIYLSGNKVNKGAFTLSNGGINQRLWMLANKGQCFRDMVVHPYVDELVGHILGKDFILSTHSANITKPGGVRMGLHTDQWWMPQPIKPGDDFIRASEISRKASDSFLKPDTDLGISPPVVANCMWMLSDFTETNGATEVVPGSHLTGAHPNQEDQSIYPVKQAVSKEGTLMVLDGRLWHGTGANTGNTDRLGVLTTFCAPQFRQQENQTIGLDRKLWDSCSNKLRSRLGFKVWNAYGRIESSVEEMIEPEPKRIGELFPKKLKH